MIALAEIMEAVTIVKTTGYTKTIKDCKQQKKSIVTVKFYLV